MIDELTEVPVDLGVEENGYLDQSYFQEPKTSRISNLEGTESVADCITGVREQLSINQYSGGSKLGFSINLCVAATRFTKLISQIV